MTDQHEIDRWHDDGGPVFEPPVASVIQSEVADWDEYLSDWDDFGDIDVDDDYALVDAEATVLVDGGEWINSLFYSDYQDAGDDDDRVTVDIPPSVTGLWSQLSAADRFDIFADDDNGRDF